jgi:glycosyltransferase involved in cell wall biosynthesis
MKVLMVSTSITGGAGGASYQLHRSLQDLDTYSRILVREKPLNLHDPTIIVGVRSKLAKGFNIFIRPTLESLTLIPYRQRHILTSNFDLFSPQWLPGSIPTQKIAAKICPDLVNLHWICGGGVRIETIPELKKPIVWTLHDMWPLTGGCHQSLSCDRYTQTCGACPQLHSGKDKDISRWVWTRKSKAWRDLDLTIVTPSSWLAKCSSSSSLFKNKRTEVIPVGVNTSLFKPLDRQFARNFLGLDQDKIVILFGAWANTSNKGFHRFLQALRILDKHEWKGKVELVVFGFSQPQVTKPDLNFPTYYLGRVRHDLMPIVYSAADVFVAPSISETFGLTVLESLSCGTPVVAFDSTGPKDTVKHKITGYLAKPYNLQDLARGIAWVLEDVDRYERLVRCAREIVKKEFTIKLMAKRYRDLFYEVCNS